MSKQTPHRVFPHGSGVYLNLPQSEAKAIVNYLRVIFTAFSIIFASKESIFDRSGCRNRKLTAGAFIVATFHASSLTVHSLQLGECTHHR
jgi:hypothetical protein